MLVSDVVDVSSVVDVGWSVVLVSAVVDVGPSVVLVLESVVDVGGYVVVLSPVVDVLSPVVLVEQTNASFGLLSRTMAHFSPVPGSFHRMNPLPAEVANNRVHLATYFGFQPTNSMHGCDCFFNCTFTCIERFGLICCTIIAWATHKH